MRQDDAGLALLLADEAARERRQDCSRLELAARPGVERSIRRRLGGAFIALGERLAGESRPVAGRRLVGQAS